MSRWRDNIKLQKRLVGAVVVGVGLPQICLERDLIKHHFDERDIPGFEYAYTYPGMNRVLQAAGRVIRTDKDRGAILLVDRRFGQKRYRRLFPPSWQSDHHPTLATLGQGCLQVFRTDL